jgi:hypothetical protein
VSTSPALLTRPSSGRPTAPDEGVGLDAVLALFADETPVSARRTLRRSGSHLLGWVRASSRRAAAWGAVAQPTAVSGARVATVATGAGQ